MNWPALTAIGSFTLTIGILWFARFMRSRPRFRTLEAVSARAAGAVRGTLDKDSMYILIIVQTGESAIRSNMAPHLIADVLTAAATAVGSDISDAVH